MTASQPSVPFDALLAHRAWVRAVARALVTETHHVDDIEQEVWLSALRRPPPHAHSLKGWLGAVTRNVSRRLTRSARTRDRHEAQLIPPGDARPAADIVAEAELQQRIAQAVLDLPEPFRSTVLMRYFEDLPPREIAERMCVPVETVRSRLRRARERLREQLTAQEGDGRPAWIAVVESWHRPEMSAPIPQVSLGLSAYAGGVVMKKLVAAAVVVLALGATAWFVHERAGSERPGTDDIAATTVVDGADDVNTRQATAEVHDEPVLSSDDDDPAGGALPDPVNLDAADRDLDLHGTVVDGAGKPVVGADIEVLHYPWRMASVLNLRNRDELAPAPATRSARDGTFSMRLARGVSRVLRATAKGFAAVEFKNVMAGERLHVVLPDAVSLRVTVSSAEGAPAPGATVGVMPAWNARLAPSFRVEAVTDANGVAVVAGLPAASVSRLDVFHREKGTGRNWNVRLPAQGAKEVLLQLDPAWTVRGRVLDATTGHPIGGAHVGMGWTLEHGVTTAADGTFVLPGWSESGHSTIRVEAAGYAALARVVGDKESLDFALQPGYAAVGRILNGRQEPVAGARVSLIAAANGDQQLSHGYAVSGPEGRFRIDGLRRGMPHMLVVLTDDYARLRQVTATTNAAESDDVDLGDVALDEPRRVEGRLVTAEAAPIRRQTVFLSGPLTGDRIGSFYGKSVTVATDDLGRFRFERVAPGSYDVVARPDGGQEIRTRIEVRANADTLGVQIRQGPVRSVTVRVRDTHGDPITGATFALTDSHNQSIQAVTDPTGEATALVPIGRKVSWSIYAPSGSTVSYLQPPWSELPADTDVVSATLTNAGFVRGRILDPEGKGVANAWFHLLESGGDQRWARSDEQGSFRCMVRHGSRCRVVFDGTVYVQGRSQDSGLSARMDDVAEGSEIVVRCTRIALDRALTVKIVSPDGKPVKGASVGLTCAGRSVQTGMYPQTDETGRASFKDLPARACSVMIFLQGKPFLPPVHTNVVPAGQVLELKCRVAVRTTGLVVDEDDAPKPYGLITARRAGETVGTARVGQDGKFVLLLPQGDSEPFDLAIDRNNDGVVDAQVVGVVPGSQDVRLQLAQ